MRLSIIEEAKDNRHGKKAEKVLREELIALLNGGNAHMGFEDAIAGFPLAKGLQHLSRDIAYSGS